MPQSFTKLYAHLIFSTKNREPFIDEAIRPRLHGYLASLMRDLDSPHVVVGGVVDHGHIVFDMGKMHAPVEFVEKVKKESSHVPGAALRSAPGYDEHGLWPSSNGSRLSAADGTTDNGTCRLERGAAFLEGNRPVPPSASTPLETVCVKIHLPGRLPSVLAGLTFLLSPAALAEAPEMLRRELHPTTVLVADGQPKAIIVAPKKGPFADAARQVRDTIREATGVALPLKSPLEVTDVSKDLPERARGLMLTAEAKKTPLLLVGNLSDNSAMFEPHLRHWFVCNKESFAEGTFRLATYENPWGTGVGYCLLGAADEAGLAKGVEALKEVIQKHAQDRDLVLPRTVAPGRDPFAHAAAGYRRLAGPERPEWMKGFRESEKMWLGYGNVRSLYNFVFATELGYLSSEELHAIENEMLATLLMFPDKVKWYRPGGTWLTDRHETFKNPRTYLACEHLLTVGHPNDAAREQLGKVAKGPKDYLSYFARNAYRCDHEDIMADHSWTNITWFALLSGEWEHFTSGLAFQAAMHALLRTDNLGALAGHNMYEGVRDLYLKSYACNAIRTAAWWYQDGRLRWLLENLPLLDKAPYSAIVDLPLDGIEAREPVEWLGAQSVPASPHSYNEALASPKWSKPGIPREHTVDRLTLRDGFAREDQYLALDGFQHEFQPLGLNCVLRYVDRGKLFLVATTGKEGNYYKSGVTVSRGVEIAPEPWGLARLVEANLDDVTLVATRVPGLNGTDWTRYIFWQRGAYFLFLDDVRALDPGLLNLTATWRTCLPAELTDEGWRQVQDDVTFHLKPGFGLAQNAGQPSPDEYQNEIRPWLLRQNLRLDATAAGDRTAFHNLLYATGPGDEQHFEARRLSAGACLVKGTRQREGNTQEELALVGIAGDHLAGLGVRTDAEMIYLSTERAALAGGSSLSLDGEALLKGKDQASQFLSKKAQKKVASRLESWWKKADRAAGHEPPPPPAKGLEVAWQFDEFQGPPLHVHPKTVAKAEDGKSWVASFGAEVAFDKVVLVGSHPSPPEVSVEFSRDGFANDIRPGPGPTQRTRITGPTGKSAQSSRDFGRTDRYSLPTIPAGRHTNGVFAPSFGGHSFGDWPGDHVVIPFPNHRIN